MPNSRRPRNTRIRPKRGKRRKRRKVKRVNVEAKRRRLARVKRVAEAAGLGDPESLKSEAQVGRNDPCPCDSGKKHKHCCA